MPPQGTSGSPCSHSNSGRARPRAALQDSRGIETCKRQCPWEGWSRLITVLSWLLLILRGKGSSVKIPSSICLEGWGRDGMR